MTSWWGGEVPEEGDSSPEDLDAWGAIHELEEHGVDLDFGPEDDGMSVGEALRLLRLVEQAQGKMQEDPAVRGQWARSSGNYTMVGDTVPKLPPGYYDLASAQGQLFFMPVARRSDKILRFPHAEVDTVISEIEAFWAREEAFAKFRLPYKRGILMYGPPGSGKTSALQLVARDVVERGGIVLLWDTDLFTSAYRQVRRVQPDTPIVVLMEDLDAILAGRNESTVLNILDGAESIHKVVFVATTNYPEKLGPRIINRPSRFDKRIRVGHPDDVGRKMYLESLVDGHDEVELDVDTYVRATKGMSLAHLKELFVATVVIGTPYDAALSHLRTMHLEQDKASSVYDDAEEVEFRRGQYA